MRKEGTQQDEKIVASDLMEKSIRKELKERNFNDFLVEVMAAKKVGGKYMVFKYPNDQIERYEESHVNRHCRTMGDKFVFSNAAKLEKYDEDFRKYVKTGYFCPASFWEKFSSNL